MVFSRKGGLNLNNIVTKSPRDKFSIRDMRNKIHSLYKNTNIRNKLLIVQVLIVCIICLVSLVLLYLLVGIYNNTLIS